MRGAAEVTELGKNRKREQIGKWWMCSDREGRSSQPTALHAVDSRSLHWSLSIAVAQTQGRKVGMGR